MVGSFRANNAVVSFLLSPKAQGLFCDPVKQGLLTILNTMPLLDDSLLDGKARKLSVNLIPPKTLTAIKGVLAAHENTSSIKTAEDLFSVLYEKFFIEKEESIEPVTKEFLMQTEIDALRSELNSLKKHVLNMDAMDSYMKNSAMIYNVEAAMVLFKKQITEDVTSTLLAAFPFRQYRNVDTVQIKNPGDLSRIIHGKSQVENDSIIAHEHIIFPSKIHEDLPLKVVQSGEDSKPFSEEVAEPVIQLEEVIQPGEVVKPLIQTEEVVEPVTQTEEVIEPVIQIEESTNLPIKNSKSIVYDAIFSLVEDKELARLFSEDMLVHLWTKMLDKQLCPSDDISVTQRVSEHMHCFLSKTKRKEIISLKSQLDHFILDDLPVSFNDFYTDLRAFVDPSYNAISSDIVKYLVQEYFVEGKKRADVHHPDGKDMSSQWPSVTVDSFIKKLRATLFAEGGPKELPKPSVSSAQQKDDINSGVLIKKRGRLAKEKPSIEEKEKKKRGRPAKEKPPIEEKEKKTRGRPRKEKPPVEIKEPKRRGRNVGWRKVKPIVEIPISKRLDADINQNAASKEDIPNIIVNDFLEFQKILGRKLPGWSETKWRESVRDTLNAHLDALNFVTITQRIKFREKLYYKFPLTGPSPRPATYISFLKNLYACLGKKGEIIPPEGSNVSVKKTIQTPSANNHKEEAVSVYSGKLENFDHRDFIDRRLKVLCNIAGAKIFLVNQESWEKNRNDIIQSWQSFFADRPINVYESNNGILLKNISKFRRECRLDFVCLDRFRGCLLALENIISNKPHEVHEPSNLREKSTEE